MIETHIFNKGRTVSIIAYITDKYANKKGVYPLIDPTSVTVTISSPADPDAIPPVIAEVKVNAGAMTKIEKGIYEYDYNIPAPGPRGTWTGKVIETDGTGLGAYSSDEDFTFEVLA